MNRVLLYLFRFAAIVVGYMVAALAASAFLHLLFLGAAGFRPEDNSAVVAGSLLFSIPFTALFVGYFAFLPSLVVILLGEVLGQRNWLFHALAGAAVGLAVAGLFWQAPMGEMGRMATDPALSVGLFIGAGIVGGLAYWLCAGRWAGGWRNHATLPGPSGS
ncbi:hypothetical protein [Mesorhizobium sp. A556]